MKISIGSDHAGLELKNSVSEYLKSKDIEVIDCGTYTSDSCDYSDFGYRAAKEVSLGNVDYGIVICSTGIGISIAANKVNGIRCGLVDNVEFAALTREHNNANMLAMGAKAVDAELAKKIVDTFLTTPFSNGPRHIRRIEKISKYEKEERNNG